MKAKVECFIENNAFQPEGIEDLLFGLSDILAHHYAFVQHYLVTTLG